MLPIILGAATIAVAVTVFLLVSRFGGSGGDAGGAGARGDAGGDTGAGDADA